MLCGWEPQGSQGAVEAAGSNLAGLKLAEYRSEAEKGCQYEYLDHTADIQLHAWGASLEEAFQNVALAMFNYMTPLEGIAVDESLTREFTVEDGAAHDLDTLLFAFLDELLFCFLTELFVCKELRVTRLMRGPLWTLSAVGRGERFDRSQHVSGTEVKAITYSAMQIRELPGDAEVFVIVDI
ncbi:hypothetical protein WJX81_005651 [Elliptochloris bilobata]|uniref:Protein archease-like n=1 Tax=Elliptochloris bilobata TaxID=381761 RepID=A0AAW1RH50_9CHLO